MMKALLSTIALGAVCPTVSAHGYLQTITVNGVDYPGWAPYNDPYITPAPTRYTRHYADVGPVIDFTGKNITCNNGPNDPSTVPNIPVKPGDKIKLKWDQWSSAHSGPVMTYLAKCTSDCKSFKGDTGNVWVKIDQMAYDTTKTPPWGSDFLAKQGAYWMVTVPPNLAPGNYVLRHEILGLHVAGTKNGAQFYPSCSHLTVSGSGTQQLPSGVALPGAYDPNDTKGVLVQLWQVNAGQVTYVAPGGSVWSGAAPQLNGA